MGVLDIDQSKVVKRWRLEPGKIFLIDLVQKKIIGNSELKTKYSIAHNYDSYLNKKQIFLKDLVSDEVNKDNISANRIKELQLAFGYTKEDVSFFLEPIIKSGLEPIDLWGLILLFHYFLQKQSFYIAILNNASLKLRTPQLILLEKNW